MKAHREVRRKFHKDSKRLRICNYLNSRSYFVEPVSKFQTMVYKRISMNIMEEGIIYDKAELIALANEV